MSKFLRSDAEVGYYVGEEYRDSSEPLHSTLGFDRIERRRCVTKVSQHGDVVTLINAFTVAPEDQQRLLDLLAEATETVIRVTAFRISQLAQEPRWDAGRQLRPVAEPRGFEAMLENPEAAIHMKEAAQTAEKFEPHMYEVSFVEEVWDFR